MESFFALLQNNVLNRRRWSTSQKLRIAIVTWAERTYHRRRRQTGTRVGPRRVRDHHQPPPRHQQHGTLTAAYPCSRPLHSLSGSLSR